MEAKTKNSRVALSLSIVLLLMILSIQATFAQGWFNGNWLYRKPITVQGSGVGPLSDIQVKINLSSSNFNFSHAKNDGSDIILTTGDGTSRISFWIEDWNTALQQATLWAKVPSIPATGTNIYIYYGNAGATSASDGISTFRLFDDFESWGSYPANTGWVDLGPQPSAFADQTSATVNGKLYVIGGYSTGGLFPQNANYMFDPENEAWETKSPMPTARWGMVAVEFNGLIYVFGGTTGLAPGNCRKNEVYNPVLDTWQTKSDIPAEFSVTGSGIMGLKYGNKIHLFFGSDHFEYDPAYDTYVRKANVPLARVWCTSAIVDSKIYLIGGDDLGGEGRSDNQMYDPLTDTWEQKAPLPGYRMWGMTRENPVIDGKIYVTHGLDNVAREFHATNWAYNPTDDTWEQKGPARHPRDGVACGVIDDKLYVIGGRADFLVPNGLFYNEVYDPSLDSWIPSSSYLWNKSVQGDVFTDISASWQGNYGLVVQQGEDNNLPDVIHTRSVMDFGDVYALDLWWNVTSDLGIENGQPESIIAVAAAAEDNGSLAFYNGNVGPVVEWRSVEPNVSIGPSTLDNWHKVTIVRNGGNSQVVFDGIQHDVYSTAPPDNQPGQLLLGVRYTTKGFFDNVRIRKWAGFDPATAPGAEESGNFNIWDGSVDSDWNDGENWSDENAPGPTSNVLIPGGIAPPHVNIANAYCNNLTINPLAELVINAGRALTITNALSNNGTLTIESGYSYVDPIGLTLSGSLIFGSTNGSGMVTYNRQLRRKSNDGDYHYFSSPVANNSSANLADVEKVWAWDEITESWPEVSMIGLESGKGYNLRQTALSDSLISFTGSLVTTDLIINATSPYKDVVINGTLEEYASRIYANDGTGHSGVVRDADAHYGGGGWNMLGNPFTSAISATAFLGLPRNYNNLEPSYRAVYLYDGNSPGHMRYYYIGAPVGDWEWDEGIPGGQSHIQAGQGFFVLAMNDTSTFTIARSMQAHSTHALMLKSTGIESRWPGLQLKTFSGGNENMTKIVFGEKMTVGLDPGYDVGLMSYGPGAGIYTALVEDNGVNFTRQALPVNGAVKSVIPVGVDSKDGGEVVFTAKTEPFRNYKYWLEDRETGVFTELGKDSYTVTLRPESYGVGRFYVHVLAGRSIRPRINEENLLEVRIWAGRERQVHIQGTVSEKAVCEVYDAWGRKVYETQLTDGDYNTFIIPSSSDGVHVVKVKDGVRTFTGKVIVL